jgi:hypothetical protein
LKDSGEAVREDLTITCVLNCGSEEALRRLVDNVHAVIDLDYIIARQSATYPNGVKTVATTHYRLGDYFNSIECIEDESDGFHLRLSFHVRRGAGSFWKDLIRETLQNISSAASGVSVEFVPQPT